MSDTLEAEGREALFERLRHEPTGGYPASEPAASDTSSLQGSIGGVIVPFSFATDAGIASVTVFPPSYGDVEAVVGGRMSELEMHANMCSISVETFRKLRWPDAEKIVIAARYLAPEIKRS